VSRQIDGEDASSPGDIAHSEHAFVGLDAAREMESPSAVYPMDGTTPDELIERADIAM
jgi:hypothetical protein